jgi:hypothetical protein
MSTKYKSIELDHTGYLDDNGVEVCKLKYRFALPIDEKQVLNYGLPKKDQKWIRETPPDFTFMSKEEKDNYQLRELKRIKNGFYFYNYGELVYITGYHYFFLSHWNLGGYYPSYRKAHRDICYLQDLCFNDQDCYGAIIFGAKRLGKTELTPSRFLADALLNTKANYFIQATKDDKANDVFDRAKNAFLSLHKTLPYIYEHSYTKDSISFRQTQTIKRSSEKVKFREGNYTKIQALPSKITSIQGEKIKEYFLDEFASQELMDMEQLYQTIIAQCTMGTKDIVGKSWFIATAENATSKALPFSQTLWDDSCHWKKNKNGRTDSGLYRMFIPFYYSDPSFIDEYGNPKIDEAKKYLENQLETASAARKKILKRQFPSNIEDVFEPISSDQLEDDVKEILKDHLEGLKKSIGQYPIQYCNLWMEGDEIKKAQKKVGINDVEEQAKWVEITEDPKPIAKYVIGVDGTNTDKLTSETAAKKSKYAIVVIKLFEGIEALNYTEVCNYAVIPNKMEDLTKMVYCIAMYYNQYGNASVMAEGNVGVGAELVRYFDNKGMLKLIRKQPKYAGTDSREVKDKYTVYADEHVNKATLGLLNIWCRRHGRNLRSQRVILALLATGAKNSDFSSAFRVGLLGCGNFDPETIKKKVEKPRGKRRQELAFANGEWKYIYV